MGPTASGKSDIALELCRNHPFEIISVDSAQIYQGMDIGTAKPDASVLEEFPHHLIDIRDPKEVYSVAEFCEEALAHIADIRSRDKIPLLVGGTMMYYKVLRDGISNLPGSDEDIRKSITDQALKEGWPAIHARLKKSDPQAARRIHPNDPQRLQRALEVFLITGESMSSLQSKPASRCPYTFCQIGIVPDQRADLYKAIEKRFHEMLELGLAEEVRNLYGRGDLNESLPSIRSVGYRQFWHHLQGRLSYAEMIERSVIATRHLAKRQLTWLRSWTGLQQVTAVRKALIDRVLKILSIDSIL